MPYVAHATEHLQDSSRESTARVFDTVEEALTWINKIYHSYAGPNHSFELYELGKRLDLTQQKTEIPQPAKVTTQVVLKQTGD